LAANLDGAFTALRDVFEVDIERVAQVFALVGPAFSKDTSDGVCDPIGDLVR
jgi:hypothetical protein